MTFDVVSRPCHLPELCRDRPRQKTGPCQLLFRVHSGSNYPTRLLLRLLWNFSESVLRPLSLVNRSGQRTVFWCGWGDYVQTVQTVRQGITTRDSRVRKQQWTCKRTTSQTITGFATRLSDDGWKWRIPQVYWGTSGATKNSFCFIETRKDVRLEVCQKVDFKFFIEGAL